MSDSWIDHIPSKEREKIRKRMRSAEAYEKLREKVKGPEDLEREMERNEQMAELRFGLETEPELHDALKSQVQEDINASGIESVCEPLSMSADAKKAVEQGKFILTVSSHPLTHQDQLTVVPEGHVQEKIPIKSVLSDRYSQQLKRAL